MIKTMMYINPLWLGMVPEIAQHFDLLPKTIDEHLIATKGDRNLKGIFKINTLNVYDQADMVPGQMLNDYLPNSTPSYLFYEGKYNVSHAAANKHAEGGIANYDKTGLYGLTSRAISTITNMIKDNLLEDLGKKINNMLSSQEARNKRYGYAGLEGIYINENILGLLEVLGRKIQKVKKPERTSYASVVCVQPEIYREEINGSNTGKVAIVKELLDPEYVQNGRVIEGSPAFVQDYEFYSQLMSLRDLIRGDNNQIGKNVFEPTSTDKFNNFLRINQFELSLYKTVKGTSKNIHDNKNNWINNYDYNKIFNKSDPPIKSILAPYLADDSFKNFYLFFVTSNNKKEDPTNPANDIDTCSKQIQLMYDTRYFMDVIANDESKGIAGQCN
jgi:hypothetical protein